MKNLKVIQFLEALSPSEFEEFDRYVRSPFFNTNQESIALFEQIKEFYPEFPAKKISKERIFHLAFPGTPYSEKKIYNLGILIYYQLLTFLAGQQIREQQKLWEPIHLIEALSHRNLDKYIPKFIEEAEKHLDSFPLRDESYFYHMRQFVEYRYNFFLSQNNRAPEEGLQLMSEQLDHYILLSKLGIAMPMANQEYILSSTEDNGWVAEAVELYENAKTETPKIADLYYQIVKMLTFKEGAEHFKKTRTLLRECRELLPRVQIYQAYLYTVNFCSKKIKEGELLYREKVFEVYKEMLEDDLLFSIPIINNINFKNLVSVSLKLKEYVWTEKFILTYKNQLDPKYQEGVSSFCLANLFFEKKEYKKSQKFLNKVDFIDPFYRINHDLLLFKIYYERGEVQALFSRTNTFEVFIRRNTSLSKNNKIAYANMVRFLKKLIRVKHDGKKNISSIRRAFEACDLMVDRNWIREKIIELE